MKLFDETLPWYKANLHTHTTVSDGKATPEEAIRLYKEAGYSVLALTDHWRVTPGTEEKDFLLISSSELDTNYTETAPVNECYHIVGIGIPADADLSGYTKKEHPQVIIDKILSLGGCPILAHPQWSLDLPQRIASLKGLCAAEVYNTVSGFPWNPDRADSSDVLDQAALLGAYLPQVASDDAHFYNGDQCRSYTMIQPKEFTVEGIKDALRNGAFYASRGPRVDQVEVTENQIIVTCSECVGAVFYSNSPWVSNRSKNTPEGCTKFVYDISKSDRFVRVEVIDKDGNRAYVSPIKIERKEQ